MRYQTRLGSTQGDKTHSQWNPQCVAPKTIIHSSQLGLKNAQDILVDVRSDETVKTCRDMTVLVRIKYTSQTCVYCAKPKVYHAICTLPSGIQTTSE